MKRFLTFSLKEGLFGRVMTPDRVQMSSMHPRFYFQAQIAPTTPLAHKTGPDTHYLDTFHVHKVVVFGYSFFAKINYFLVEFFF